MLFSTLSNTDKLSKYPKLGIQFHDKENPLQLKHFYQEEWKILYLPIPYSYLAFTFQRTSNSCNNELLLLLFVGLWKVKIILCLNGSLKFQNAWKAFDYPALIGNCKSCSHSLSPVNPLNGLLLVYYRWCAANKIL